MIVIDLDCRPNILLRPGHSHYCPTCYEDAPCADTCHWAPDLSEPGHNRGATTLCDECRDRVIQTQKAKPVFEQTDEKTRESDGTSNVVHISGTATQTSGLLEVSGGATEAFPITSDGELITDGEK